MWNGRSGNIERARDCTPSPAANRRPAPFSPAMPSANRSAIAWRSSTCTTGLARRRGWCRRRGPSPAIAASSSAGTARCSLRRRSTRQRLSDRVGPGLDPCGAVQLAVTLEPGEERTLIGQLGEARDAAAARASVQRFREADAVRAAANDAIGFWDGLLATVAVRTPEPSMDLMLNRWLLYQALSCRIWGRSAFYQSSGAFGFRDQLQDSLALLHSSPQLVRAQLLRAASRQFVEGDVQHWWHEPGGQGVRTRFSDDRLWLIFCSLLYVQAHGRRRGVGRAGAVPRRPAARGTRSTKRTSGRRCRRSPARSTSTASARSP